MTKMSKKSFVVFVVVLLFILQSFTSSTYSMDNQEVFKGYFINPEYDNLELFLQTGTQTKAYDIVKERSREINDNKDISTLAEIFREVTNISNVKSEDPDRFYDNVEYIYERGLTGCTDYGLVFAALAREKGIPTVFVQAAKADWVYDAQQNNGRHIYVRGHIFVEVYINGYWYLVDSTAGKAFISYDRNNFNLPNGYIAFAKSLEVLDVNNGASHTREEKTKVFADFDLDTYEDPMYEYYDINDANRILTMSSSKYELDEELERLSQPIKKSSLIVGTGETCETLLAQGYSGSKVSIQVMFSKYDYENANITMAYNDELENSYRSKLEDFLGIEIELGKKQVVENGEYIITLYSGEDEAQLLNLINENEETETDSVMDTNSVTDTNNELSSETVNSLEIQRLNENIESLQKQIDELTNIIENLMKALENN